MVNTEQLLLSPRQILVTDYNTFMSKTVAHTCIVSHNKTIERHVLINSYLLHNNRFI